MFICVNIFLNFLALLVWMKTNIAKICNFMYGFNGLKVILGWEVYSAHPFFTQILTLSPTLNSC